MPESEDPVVPVVVPVPPFPLLLCGPSFLCDFLRAFPTVQLLVNGMNMIANPILVATPIGPENALA